MIGSNEYLNGEFNSARSAAERDAVAKAKAVAPAEEPKAEITVGNVRKYVTAEMSLQLYGPVSDLEFEARKAACMACDLRHDSPQMSDKIGFCKGCGCGVNQRARLSVKLTMPDSECPKRKWGKAPGRHARIMDRLKAWMIRKLIH
jgi:hypothetical protein